MKLISILFLLLPLIAMSQSEEFINHLYYSYEDYREPEFTNRRFNNAILQPLIKIYANNRKFTVTLKGESVEKRPIHLITIGSGKTKVFLWSQMHGDEPTATMALFDIFRFFRFTTPFDTLKERILSELTLYFMPMVNPDGAERFQRRNAYDIDINRDASRIVTPESDILMRTFLDIKPDFGFNLHDQSPRYSVGNSPREAVISYLAPAYNYNKDINENRENAIKLISGMVEVLSRFVPGHLAKYQDDYEPRAYGDNFQLLGAATILIESGGWKNDREKDLIRKLNFISLLSAFENIASKRYVNASTIPYDELPFNEKYLFDLILRNGIVHENGQVYKADIAVNMNEINTYTARDYYLKSSIEDIGDLSVFYGFDELDLEGCIIEQGKIWDEIITRPSDLSANMIAELHSQGFTAIRTTAKNINGHNFPLNIYSENHTGTTDGKITIGAPCNLVVKRGEKIVFLVVNGQIIKPGRPLKNFKNSL